MFFCDFSETNSEEMRKETTSFALTILSLFTFTGVEVVRADCQVQNLVPVSIQNLKNQTNEGLQPYFRGCEAHPTEKEQAVIHEIFIQTSKWPVPQTEKEQNEYLEKTRALLRQRGAELSPEVKVSLIAQIQSQKLKDLSSHLEDENVKHALGEFNAELNRFKENREKWLGGVRNFDEDANKLQKQTNTLLDVLKHSGVPELEQKHFKKMLFRTLKGVYARAGDRAGDAARQFEKAYAWTAVGSSTVLAVDLLVMSFLTAGATIPAAKVALAASGASWALVVASGYGAASVAMWAGGISLASNDLKYIGHAMTGTKEDGDFSCKLALEFQRGNMLDEAFVSAVGGAIVGGLLGPFARIAPGVTRILGYGAAVYFNGKGAVSAIQVSAESYDLFYQAELEAKAGREQNAIALLERAKLSRVDSVVDVANAVLSSSTMYKNTKQLLEIDKSGLSLKDKLSVVVKKLFVQNPDGKSSSQALKEPEPTEPKAQANANADENRPSVRQQKEKAGNEGVALSIAAVPAPAPLPAKAIASEVGKVEKPVQPIQKPVQPIQKPVQPIQKPVQPIQKPVQPIQKPVAQTLPKPADKPFVKPSPPAPQTTSTNLKEVDRIIQQASNQDASTPVSSRVETPILIEARAAKVAMNVAGSKNVRFRERTQIPRNDPRWRMMDEVVDGKRTGRKVTLSYEKDVHVVPEGQASKKCCIIEAKSSRNLHEDDIAGLKRLMNTDGKWDILNPGGQESVIVFAPNLSPESEAMIHNKVGPNVLITRTEAQLRLLLEKLLK